PDQVTADVDDLVLRGHGVSCHRPIVALRRPGLGRGCGLGVRPAKPDSGSTGTTSITICVRRGQLGQLGAMKPGSNPRPAWVTGMRGVGWQDSLASALAWERSVC